MKRIVRIGALLLAALWLLAALPVTAAESAFSVGRAAAAPVLDGVLSPGEWGEALYVLHPGEANAYLERESDRIELPDQMAVYMMWDETFLYLAATVESEHHYNQQSSDVTGWDGNAILLTIETEGGRDRLSCALGLEEMSLFGLHNRSNADAGANREESSDCHTGKVARAGRVTTYEAQVRWADLEYKPAKTPAAGVQFRASVTAYLADSLTQTYAGSLIYMDPASADEWTRPWMVLTGDEANPDFDPSQVTTTAPPATTTETPATTTATAAPTEKPEVDGRLFVQILTVCLAVAALGVIAALIVILIRRKK